MSVNNVPYRIFQGHTDSIYSVIPYQSDTLLSIGGDGYLVQWNLKGEDLNGKALFNAKETLYTLLNLDDLNLLCIGSRFGNLYILDNKNNKLLKTIYLDGDIFTLSHTNKSNFIVAGTSKGLLYLIDIESFEVVKSLQIAQKSVREIRYFPPIHSYLISTSDGTVLIINENELSVQQMIVANQPSVFSALFLPNDKIVTAGRDAQMQVFIQNQENNWELERLIPAHWYAINKLIYIKEDNVIVSASRDKSIKVWDANDFTLLSKLDGVDAKNTHTHSVNSINYDVQNRLLLSGGDDRVIRVYQM
jgi:WD40 repeat protein